MKREHPICIRVHTYMLRAPAAANAGNDNVNECTKGNAERGRTRRRGCGGRAAPASRAATRLSRPCPSLRARCSAPC